MALNILSPPDILCEATNQGIPHGTAGTDAFTMAWQETTLGCMSLQLLESKVLSRDIIRKSAPLLTEITIRKSQFYFLHHMHYPIPRHPVQRERTVGLIEQVMQGNDSIIQHNHEGMVDLGRRLTTRHI